MKSILFIFSLLLVSYSFAQFSDVTIFNSDTQKVRFRMISDDYGCLLFNQIGYSECELVNIEESNDTIYLTQSLDYLLAEPTRVFLSDEGFKTDFIRIKSLFANPFMEGHAMFEELHYEIDGMKYYPDSVADSGDYEHVVRIKRPEEKEFEISIFRDEKLMGTHAIKLEETQNLIQIEHSEVSTHVFYFHDYDSVFPCKINLNDRTVVLEYISL